jgi:hypothetical protein
VANNEVFWIDANGRMHSSDGSSIKNYPDSAQNLVDPIRKIEDVDTSQCHGYRINSYDYDWVVWSWPGISSLTGPSHAIIWDLRNECWLYCSVGFDFTCTTTFAGKIFGGLYTKGYVCTPDSAGYGSNDTNDVTSITHFWRTGWMAAKTIENIVQIRRCGLDMSTRGYAPYSGPPRLTGSWTVSYGYDFSPDLRSFTLSANDDNVDETFQYGLVVGRGANTVQFKFSWTTDSPSNAGAIINNILYAGKQSGESRRIGTT